MTADFVVLAGTTWTSNPLASFEAMEPQLAARFGPPVERDLDSNGIGLFDARLLGFVCGLEIALWRFHCGRGMKAIDPNVEPSLYEVHANATELAHIAFHLGVAVDALAFWIDDRDRPYADIGPERFAVMRSDDNGNTVEVRRFTSRCEAEACVHDFEARGHKQSYWLVDTASAAP